MFSGIFGQQAALGGQLRPTVADEIETSALRYRLKQASSHFPRFNVVFHTRLKPIRYFWTFWVCLSGSIN